jgi:hypothetical protein
MVRQSKKTCRFGFCLVVLILLSSCALFTRLNKDPFYNDSGGIDSYRLPLLKPYYLRYLNSETSWDMELHADPPSETTYYYLTLHDIRKVAIENGVIMVYTPFIEGNIDKSIGQKVYHWFVIVPEANIEEGFDSESALLEYVKRFDIEQVDWQNPDDLYTVFTKTGCLNWIPDCQ